MKQFGGIIQLDFTNNRKAFITGGAQGFGLGTAKELLNIGAHVTIADISEEAIDKALKDLNSDSVDTCIVDVRNKDSVTTAINESAEKMGGLDTLINSAGVFEFNKLEDISEEEWDWIMDVNAKGTFLAMQAAAPYIKESNNGRVVNLSSDGGKKGFAMISTYCASKFAVTGMTQAVSGEFARFGATVNAVCPSSVAETGMGKKVADQKVKMYKELGFSKGDLETIFKEGAEFFPLKRLGTVKDVVSVIMYLISENASWITGESVNIDGGSLAG